MAVLTQSPPQSSTLPALAERADAPQALLRRLGAWSLVAPYAAGEFAELFTAQPAARANEGPRYLIKVLRAEHRNDPLPSRQFRNEFALGKRITHPHLAPVLDGDPQGKSPFFVMPLLEGTDLAATLRSGARLPTAQIWGITRQVAEALSALHEHGVLHGDVKPANVLVADDGHVTLLDLGSSRPIAEAAAAWDRPVLGTPAYLAPEQFTGTLRCDERSDLFALGATLFELLTERPFRTNAKTGLDRDERGDPASIRGINPHVTSAGVDLVRRLTAHDPARRPDSAAAVVAELARLEVAAWSAWWSDEV